MVVKTAENFSVKQTEWVKQDLNPVWPPFELEVNACGGLDHMLTFQVWDHDEKTEFLDFLYLLYFEILIYLD